MGYTKKEYEDTLPVFPSLRRQLKEQLDWVNEKQDLDTIDLDYQYELYRQRQLEAEQEAYEQHLGDR
jgi:hypothetical protein